MHRFAHGRRKSWNERGPDVGQVQALTDAEKAERYVITETDGTTVLSNNHVDHNAHGPSVVTIAKNEATWNDLKQKRQAQYRVRTKKERRERLVPVRGDEETRDKHK
jgi:hypothetical protein